MSHKVDSFTVGENVTSEKTMLPLNEFNQPIGNAVESWRPAKKPGGQILTGHYCVLEPIDVNRHADALFENLSIDNKGESWTYLPYGPFFQKADFRAWVEETNAESDTQLYAILNLQGEPIGVAGFLRTNTAHGVIEIGHVHYSKRLQKTPAATEAIYLLMQYAFDTLGNRRCEWKCHSLNEASRNAALRLGFTFEGIFRQSNVFKNHNRDTAWFSVIDSEWPALKIKLSRWLDRSNFDADGNQLLRLQEIGF